MRGLVGGVHTAGAGVAVFAGAAAVAWTTGVAAAVVIAIVVVVVVITTVIVIVIVSFRRWIIIVVVVVGTNPNRHRHCKNERIQNMVHNLIKINHGWHD